LIACFQPHLFTRTRDFATEFGQALALADLVVVTEVYPSREDPIPGVSGELVADAARAAGAEVVYVADRFELPSALAALVAPGDLVITLGAGNITETGPALLAEMERSDV
jgi:UDP-N-acetylmuramate--alanine ligase